MPDETVSYPTVRPLTLDDQFAFVDLVSELLEDPREFIKMVLASLEEGADDSALLERVMSLILDVYGPKRDAVNGFLASLVGLSAEEYRRCPLGTDMNVVEQVRARPEFGHFLTGLSRLRPSG